VQGDKAAGWHSHADSAVGVQGLAYSVSGGWNTTPADHVGLFVAGGETAKPVEFLAALQRVLQVCLVPLITMTASCGSACDASCVGSIIHALFQWMHVFSWDTQLHTSEAMYVSSFLELCLVRLSKVSNNIVLKD